MCIRPAVVMQSTLSILFEGSRSCDERGSLSEWHTKMALQPISERNARVL